MWLCLQDDGGEIHFYYVAQCVQRLAEMVIEFFFYQKRKR